MNQGLWHGYFYLPQTVSPLEPGGEAPVAPWGKGQTHLPRALSFPATHCPGFYWPDDVFLWRHNLLLWYFNHNSGESLFILPVGLSVASKNVFGRTPWSFRDPWEVPCRTQTNVALLKANPFFSFLFFFFKIQICLSFYKYLCFFYSLILFCWVLLKIPRL